jgi:hypothetical protein
MNVLRTTALLASFAMTVVFPRAADAMVYNLSSSAGTVTVTQTGSNVVFDVLLSGSNVFLDSAANSLDAFVFNTNLAPGAVTITNINLFPTPNGSSSAAVDSTLPQTEGIFGSFTEGLTFHKGSKNENELIFTVDNITLGNLVGNSSGFLFAADVGNTDGVGGVVGVAAVPEASAWAMMILGFFGVGFMAYRRKGARPQLRLA